MIEAVLFDMDGVMFDTERLSRDCWREVSVRMNFRLRPGFIESMTGRNKKDCTAMMKMEWGKAVDITAIRMEREKAFNRFIQENGVPIKPGLIELLSYLKEEGIKICLATSTERKRAEELLRLSGVYGYFQYLLCGDMVTKGKPDPEIYQRCAELVRTAPDKCLVLEDSPAGIRAAFDAGCRVAMIPDCIPPSENERVLTDAVLNNLSETIELIKIMCKKGK